MVGSTYCRLVFRPSADLITIVRRFTNAFFDKVLADEEASSKLALAAHELLENIQKYSLDGEGALTLEVVDLPAGREARLVIENRTSDENKAILRGLFGEMTHSSDSKTFFQEILVRNANRPASRTGGGVGLARIWAEADMTLTLGVDGERISISAVSPVTTQRAS